MMRLRHLLPVLALMLVSAAGSCAGADAAAGSPPEAAAATDADSARPSPPHRFCDRANVALFAGVAGSRAFDYASTRHFRRRAQREILLTDAIVDDKPLFVAIEAAGAAAQIGACAWLHAHDHHKLERWISAVHIGITTFGAVRNYTLGRGVVPQ